MNEEAASFRQCTRNPVLVVGANGFVGSHITRQLVETGRDVRVLIRKTSNTISIDDLPVQRFFGDVFDIESLKSAMRGCGTVFYCVVDTRAWLSDPSPLYRCNVDGLVNALKAARAESVERFIFTSSIATIGIEKGGMASERTPYNWWDKAPHYIRSRVEAENTLLEYCREYGFPGIALCVANTYGPGDTQPTPHGHLLWRAASGKLSRALDCSAPTVDIRDAAQAALLAERYGRVGERYIVANEFASQQKLYSLAATRLGQKPPRKMGLKLVYAMAAINEILAGLTGRKDYKLRRDSIFLSEVFGPLDNSKIVTELGWHPRPIEESVHDAVAWFSTHRTKFSRIG
jgi:dihydroflavonol-4-reductase